MYINILTMITVCTVINSFSVSHKTKKKLFVSIFYFDKNAIL